MQIVFRDRHVTLVGFELEIPSKCLSNIFLFLEEENFIRKFFSTSRLAKPR